MRTSAFWFGSKKCPLFGYLHVPLSRNVRGVVVLVPPLGREQVVTAPTYRYLAELLVDLNYAVLRFDLAGTGNSSDVSAAAGLVPAWLNSVTEAIGFARGLTILGRVTVIAMRASALLLSAVGVASLTLGDAVVLWDPVKSGRSFLREQTALRSIALGHERESGYSFEGLGYRYDEVTAGQIASLRYDGGQFDSRVRAIVLIRHGEGLSNSLLSCFAADALATQYVGGQVELLASDALNAQVPSETCTFLAAWLAIGSDDTSALVDCDARRAVELSVHVTERVVWVEPAGLFGVLTEPISAATATKILFVNTSVESHVGTGRIWVDLARAWAARGLASVRLDLSGLSESPGRPGQKAGVVYAAEAVEDIQAMAAQVNPLNPSDVILVGHCSGAFASAEAGLALHCRAMILVNLIPASVVELLPEFAVGRTMIDNVVSRGSVSRRLVRPLRGLVRTALGKRLMPHIPRQAWMLADTLRLVRSPMKTLNAALRQGTQVLLVVGSEDAPYWEVPAWWTLQKRSREGGLVYHRISNLDHGMLRNEARAELHALIFGSVEKMLRLPG